MNPIIPRLPCPKCGTNMRLAEVLPDRHDKDIIKFDCRCGFICTVPPSAEAERPHV